MSSIEQLTEQLKLLSDKNRLTILACLKEKEMCVCDIVEILQTTQSNVSQHLKRLKNGGLVNETRKSQWVYYSLNVEDKPHLKEIVNELPSMRERINAVPPQSCE